MAKTRLVKNSKGQYGIYDPFTDQVTPITSDMSLVKNTRGKYGFKSGNQVFELDENPKSINLEQTFKKKVDTGLSSATSSTDSTSDFYKPVGVKAAVTAEDPKETAKAKIAEKQAQGSRFVDMFGLGQLDYSGLQKYGALGEFAADVVDIPANLSQALMRGIGGGVVGSEIHESLENGGNLNSDKIARINKENALRTGSTYLNTLKEKGVLQTEDLSAAGGIAEIVVESIGNMIGAYKKGFQGAVAGGSAGMAGNVILTEVGAAVGGPIGAAIAAGITTTSGALIGMRGMTSYATEYGSSIMESLQKKGVDVTDKDQLDKALKDKSTLDEARSIANTRGLTIGIFDAITDGIAGKGANMAVKIAERSALKSGKILTAKGAQKIAGRTAAGIELTGGPLGEATAQLATEGKIKDWDAVALEAVADLGPAAPTTAYAMYKAGQINSDLNQENLTKIEALKKAKESLPDENEASKKALDNKISSLEKENKERNNTMTSALQAAPVPATKRVLELTDAIQDIETTLEAIKDGSRTDISQEAKKAMWDSLNDMIAERDEIRQEMLKASENESKLAAVPEKPMVPVVNIKPFGQQAKEGEELPSPIPQNNATQLAKDTPLEVKKVDNPVMFSTKFDDEKSLKQGTAYKVSQGDNNFGTIIEHDVNGEKEFVLAETGKKYSSLDDAKFALQEKLTGERVSEKDRVGVDRVKVEGNLASKPIFIGDPANNNQLDIESKGAIQRAVRALRSVSNANVYLYGNASDYAKGLAHATGQTANDVANQAGKSNAQVVDANGENSIHINLEKADITSLSHEVFHGALLGLAKKDPNAFITMRDKILDRISEKQSLMVTNPDGTKAKVSAKEYLLDFQKRYSGSEYTEADRAEEFLSELAGLMSLEDNNVVKDKSLLDSIKLTIKDVLKKFNVEFDSLNELQDSEDLVQFFKEFNRSVKTGEAINLSRVEGIQGTAPAAAQDSELAEKISDIEDKELEELSALAKERNLLSEEDKVATASDYAKRRREIRDTYAKQVEELKKQSATAPAQPDTQPTAQAKPAAASQLVAPNTVTPAQPVEQPIPGQHNKGAAWHTLGGLDTKGGEIKQISDTTISDENTSKREGGVLKISSKRLFAKTVIGGDGNVYTGFWLKDGDLPNQSHQNVHFAINDKKNSLKAFEEGYGILISDALAQQGVKLKPNEKVTSIMVGGEKFVTENGKPVRVVETVIKVGEKYVSPNGLQEKHSNFNIGVPKLIYTNESKIPVGGLVTNSEGVRESEPIKIKGRHENDYMKLSVLKNGETVIEHVGLVGKSMFVDMNGTLMHVNMFNKESSSGSISEKDFNESYGLNAQKIIDDYNKEIQKKHPGVAVDGFMVKAEVIKPNGEKQVVVRLSVGGRDEGFSWRDYPIKYIDVQKLKYANEFTGISTAQPEAGAVKESATTRPEGAKKKESVAKVISAATDKAKPSVKKEPATGKKTVGNKKSISERVIKATGILGQALAIEPSSARDFALQFFVSGGRVIRGKVTNGAKPAPHSLITLFAKSRQGIYFADEKEMSRRGLLTKSDGLTITEIAHKLWESKTNETLQIDEQEFRDAVESVLLDHSTTSSMAKEMLDARGSATQRALISGNNKIAGMDEYELWTHEQVAKIFGVSVEEVIDNPEKFVNQETLDGMYDDMLSAFEILDKIQDEDAIKQYLEISTPEDLFLDELVAEVAKPEKTLQEKKDDLEKQIKAKKKELAAANKAKKEMGGIGQTSLVGGVQTTIVAPDTMALYGKIKNLKGEIEDLDSQLGKVESAIEFKERKTIDAFADVVEQKAEESAPPVAPANEEDKPQWLKEREAESALRDKEDFELMRLGDEVYSAQNRIAGASDAEAAIKNYNEVKAKRDTYENSVNKRRQDREDAIELQSLIDDEINDSKNPKYEYAEDFKKSPLLAAYKRAQEMIVFLSGSDYVDAIVKNGYETREEALARQERGLAVYENNMFLIETAIVKESMAEQAAKAEENNNTLGNEARLAMSKEIDDQLAAKENQLIENQNQGIEKAKGDIAAIKNGDKSIIDEYVKKSGYQLVTKEVIANNPNSQILKNNEGSYYKNLGYQIKVGTAQQIALQGATNKAGSKATGSKTTNQYQDAYNAISKLSKGEITPEEARSIIENSGLTAPKAIMAKATTKSQLSGARVTPFEKADPTYKYQLSGTESSLKLIDEVRKKYNMQHTAEEMGIVKKGIRATEGAISNNIVTRVLSKGSVAVNKMFSNDKANKLLGKPFAGLQNYIANNVRLGLSSQNAAASNASAIAVSLIQNLGSTEGFQSARNKLTGGKSVAKNQLWQLGKELNEMINNDKLALRRVHSLLDPEAFADITDATLPDSKADLSFAELRLFNVLRDMNDYIHEWHYRNGFLGEGAQAEALYEKNKGSYFARMYNEIEAEKFGELYDALAKLPNAADFSMFKERKDFLDVTESLTLKEDPIYITTKRFGQMMQNQAILEFCDYVANSKDYQIYKNKEDIPASAASNYRLLAPKKGGGKVYGALTGKYVPDIVAQQLRGIEFSNQAINLTYQAAKIFDKTFLRQVLSKSKTVWNPLTRAGNITMNFVFASLAGVDPITLLKNRPAAKESLESYDSYARDLDANGLLGVSMGKELNEEKDENAKIVLRDAANRLLKREGKVTSEVKLPASEKSKFRKIASDLDDMLTESYGKSDDVAKVALYKSLVDDYGKTREEAIKIVAGSMQNYNTVGKAYDFASKTANRFVKFKADSARILYNSFKDRPLNLMATLGMYLAAQSLASKVSGEDEEERKIREERPYTNKIKFGPVTISLTMKFGDTEVNVARYLAPYSVYDAGYDSNWLKDASTYLPLQYDEHTFIAVNDPLIGPLVNLAADKDFRGMPISDPGKTPFIEKTVTDGEAVWNRVAFAARNFGAPYYGWGENLVAAATGDKDYYGRSRSMSEAILNTVIKVQTVNNETLQKTYVGALRKLDRDIDNIGKTISHKANEKAKNIDEAASREGMTDERLQKFIAKEERDFIKFYEEQSKEADQKIMELQRVQGVVGRLQQIGDRKK